MQENFTKAVTLFESLLKNCEPDEAALSALKARIAKSRTDAKLNKGAIMSGLVSYARFGDKNPFNYTLSDVDLKAATSSELVDMLHSLNTYSHKIIYYGPQLLVPLTAAIKQLHPIPATFKAAPEKVKFTNTTQTTLELYNTSGAEGAARGAAYGFGFYASLDEAFKGLKCIERIEPNHSLTSQYQDLYQEWKNHIKLEQ